MDRPDNVRSNRSSKAIGERIPKHDVLRRLLQREQAGMSLKVRDVQTNDWQLFLGVVRYFRRWSDALCAVGIDPESISGRRIWTKGRIIRKIRDLERRGMAMNVKSVNQLDSGLYQAACRLWDSWDDAISAAGFDATTIRSRRKPWTRSEIIDTIQMSATTTHRLSQNTIRPKSLCQAAKRLFGSFEAALEAAGVTNLPSQWSRANVVAAIHKRIQSDKPINFVAVFKTDRKLYNAARYYFENWNQALRAAGIDPNCVRIVRRQWTRDSVIQELCRRVAEGIEPTYVSKIRPITLVKACEKLFGSLEAATEAARIDMAKITCSCARHNRQPSRGMQGVLHE